MNLSTQTLEEVFKLQKAHFEADARFQSVSERRKKLKNLKQWVSEHRQDIKEALFKDFNKPEREVLFSEILPVVRELRETIKHLADWSKPKQVPAPLLLLGTRSKVITEPKGVVLIIAPWNFPFMLTVGPLVSALAAGNTVILKPSEHVPATSALLQKMVSELFDPKEVALFQGDAAISGQLLDLPFDHIFFTGSTRVGKIVMEKAAKHLTPVTLELGGQNPVIVDETASIKRTAHRMAWGKLMNAGQSCVAPNIAFVHVSKYEKLKTAFQEKVQKMYGENMESEMASIINQMHYDRLQGLLQSATEKGAEIIRIGTDNPQKRFMAPTWVGNATPEMSIMQEEIFGPMLAVLTYEKEEEVFEFLETIGEPLASYIFSSSSKNIKRFTQKFKAGATLVNETTIHFAQASLPFGGIGQSGMGKGHGHEGFKTFSHERAVLKQWRGKSTVYFAEAPSSKFKQKVLEWFTWRF